MKKLAIVSAFLLTLLSAVPFQENFADTMFTAKAESYEEQIEYNDMLFSHRENRENELILYAYFGTEPNLVIPETINGYTVTGIDNIAFSNNKGKGYVVENVTLPDSINYFGREVFKNSTVVSINIPKSLKVIPSNTFSNCKNLKNVVFHDKITGIASSAFRNTDIVIPENLQNSIADDSVSIIENSNSKYNSINIDFLAVINTDEETGNSYCSINEYIGKSTEIKLPKIFFEATVKSFDFSNSDMSGITSVTFPETDTEISVAGNSLCNSLITELNINSPCILGTKSFGDCKNLKTVKFRDNATIDERAFSGCTNLTSVEFDGKVDLSYYAFMECNSIENITLDTSQTIQGNAFDGCTSLMNINSEPVFDSTTGDFKPEYSDFIKNSFYMAEEIGFLNEYTKAQYEKIAHEVTTPDMSDTEKVKAIHDWICDNTRYADSIIPLEYHTDASILLNNETVCEGYAKAFNLLCNSVGVETYYIHSSDHAWNIVKLGGHYFHVDTTWDDGDNPTTDWFMKSDSEMTESHGTWNAYIPTSLHSFQKEGTPECKYQSGDVNTDGEISVADLVKMMRFLLGAETETSDNIVLYDLNFDGETDVFDMILMRQKFMN